MWMGKDKRQDQDQDKRQDKTRGKTATLLLDWLTLAEGGLKSPDCTQASTWSGVAATQLHTGGCVPSR